MTNPTYWTERKRRELLTLNRFYELVLALDTNYSQSLGSIRTTLSSMTIYKLKKQAAADVAASFGVPRLKNKPTRELHVDLINDPEFMKFCISLSHRTNWIKCRCAYRTFCEETTEAAAKALDTTFPNIYRMIKIYKAAAEQYKRLSK